MLVHFNPAAVNWQVITITCAFMLLDVVSGVCNACMHGKFQSSAMRQGLWHKCATLMVMLAASLCDGVSGAEVSVLGVPLGAVEAFGAMAITMELGSFLENCLKMNPDLNASRVFQMFNVDKPTDDDVD